MAVFFRRLKQKPKRVLVSRTDRIGDFILTLPVLEVLKKEGIEPSVLCRSTVKPLLENNPFVDQIIAVDAPGADPVESVLAERFDCLLVLVNDPLIRQLLPRLRKIPVRIGPLSKPSVLLSYTHPVLQKRSRSEMNEAEYNLALLEVMGVSAVTLPKPRLFLQDEEIGTFQVDHAAILPKSGNEGLMILHQGMGGSALNWRESSYDALLTGILEQGHHVILTGTGEEEAKRNRECIDRFQPSYPERLFDMTNCLTLRQLSVLIHISDLFIGPSTGPTHLANAVGTRLIAFYPPVRVQSIRRWGPFLAAGRLLTPDVNCRQKFKCIGEKCPDYYCMDRIRPEEVLGIIDDMLSNGKRRRAVQ